MMIFLAATATTPTGAVSSNDDDDNDDDYLLQEMWRSHALALLCLVYVVFLRTAALGHERNKEHNNNNNNKNNNNIRDTTTATTTRPRPRLSLSFLLAKAKTSSSIEQLPETTSSIASSEDGLDDDDDDHDATSNATARSSNPEQELLQQLQEYCPASTDAERRRFLTACNHNVKEAAARWQHYWEWHQTYHQQQPQSIQPILIQPTGDPDYDVWVQACWTAQQQTACGGGHGQVTGVETTTTTTTARIVLPRVIRSLNYSATTTTTTTDHDDDDHPQQQQQGHQHRIFYILPGMMDDKLAPHNNYSTYTLAVALYLDALVQRDSMETVTLVVDVRAGRGWPNVHAVKLVPFIKTSLQLLLTLFPERLHKCVVYPVPSAFFYLWSLISKCMEDVTAAKICIVSGKCTMEAAPPTEQLEEHLGKEAASLLEPYRVSKFKC